MSHLLEFTMRGDTYHSNSVDYICSEVRYQWVDNEKSKLFHDSEMTTDRFRLIFRSTVLFKEQFAEKFQRLLTRIIKIYVIQWTYLRIKSNIF